MGRLSDALAAGAAAVARAEVRRASVGAGAGAFALLVPGLSGKRLSAALAAFAAAVPSGAGRVVVADHLPPDLDPRTARQDARTLVFEHLSPMDDLLAHATPAAAVLHRVRRLRLIVARRGVIECRWAGAEAEEIVRAAMAEDLVWYRALPPPLATGDPGGHARTDPASPILFRTIAFRD